MLLLSLLLLSYNSMRNQYRIHVNFRKHGSLSKKYEHVLLLLLRNGKEHKWNKKKTILHGFMLT